jgi:hypothetical protein
MCFQVDLFIFEELCVQISPLHVKEAYRLLQKSLIFVETEDIELEDNEEGGVGYL